MADMEVRLSKLENETLVVATQEKVTLELDAPIVNRVALSSLITLDLEELAFAGPRKMIDLKDWLFEGEILREVHFRGLIDGHDWEQYRGAAVAFYCSEDAIIPAWAYMLIASRLAGKADFLYNGTEMEMEEGLFHRAVEGIEVDQYQGAKVVLKGCSTVPVPASAYMVLTFKLAPVVKSLMYGEACSAVPVFKNRSV
jgi:hypothetical protein